MAASRGVRLTAEQMAFLRPDEEEKASGRVRINGVLVKPVAHSTDEAVIEVIKELAAAQATRDTPPEDAKKLNSKMETAMRNLPAKFRHHQFLHEIFALPFSVMDLVIDAKVMEHEISTRERKYLDVRSFKHFRQIFRDGSLFSAVDRSFSGMIIDVATNDVVHNPGAWEGYSVELIAYAIHRLHEGLAKLAEYREKRIAMGFDNEEKRTDTHYMTLIHEWDQ